MGEWGVGMQEAREVQQRVMYARFCMGDGVSRGKGKGKERKEK